MISPSFSGPGAPRWARCRRCRPRHPRWNGWPGRRLLFLLCRRQLKGQSLHYIFNKRTVCSVLDTLSVVMALLTIIQQAALQQKTAPQKQSAAWHVSTLPSFPGSEYFSAPYSGRANCIDSQPSPAAFRQILCCQAQRLAYPGTQFFCVRLPLKAYTGTMPGVLPRPAPKAAHQPR